MTNEQKIKQFIIKQFIIKGRGKSNFIEIAAEEFIKRGYKVKRVDYASLKKQNGIDGFKATVIILDDLAPQHPHQTRKFLKAYDSMKWE